MGILGQFLLTGSWLAPLGLAVFASGVILPVMRPHRSRLARLLRTWGAGAFIEGVLLVWFFFSHIDNAPETELTTYLVLLVLVPAVALLRTILLLRRPELTWPPCSADGLPHRTQRRPATNGHTSAES